MKEKMVFIVDDDRIIQNLLEYIFGSRGGYEVKVFASGEDCINNLELKPDLIILDHLFLNKDLTLMNGLDTLDKLRIQNNSVPVIILSNQPSQELIEEFYRRGATGYIPKEDYFIDYLFECIEKIPTLQ